MDTRDFSQLMAASFDSSLNTPKKVKQKMKSIAKSNETHLAKVELPDMYRIPTAEELQSFREYAINYKKQIKRASKREIRNAVKAHFNIILYK